MKYQKFIAALVLLFAASFAVADKININTADAAALEAGLVGIGPAKAAAIVKYREEHGPFKTVAGLADVQGIGAATLEKNKEKMMLGDEAASATPAQ